MCSPPYSLHLIFNCRQRWIPPPFLLLILLLALFVVVLIPFFVSSSYPSFPIMSKSCSSHKFVSSSLSPLEVDLSIPPLIFFPLFALLPLFLTQSSSLEFFSYSSSFFLLLSISFQRNASLGMPRNFTAVISTKSSSSSSTLPVASPPCRPNLRFRHHRHKLRSHCPSVPCIGHGAP